MKKNIYLALGFCLLALINLTNSSCECDEVQVAADLAVASFNLNKDSIPVNSALSLGAIIANLFGANCEVADEAEDFYNDYEVFYRATPTSSWESKGGLGAGDYVHIPKLESGQSTPAPHLEMRLNVKGEYYIVCKADITKAVAERNEGNNAKQSSTVGARSLGAPSEPTGIVRVYVTEDTDLELMAENIRNNRFFEVVK